MVFSGKGIMSKDRVKVFSGKSTVPSISPLCNQMQFLPSLYAMHSPFPESDAGNSKTSLSQIHLAITRRLYM